MSYKITFRDKTSTTVDTSKGEKLKELMLSTRPPENIEINGELYRRTEIISVKKAIGGHDNIPNFDRPALGSGDKCKGQFSIQREINNMIKDQYPKDWAKRIGNTKFREEIRKKLRQQPGVLWCDHRANECACDKDKPADPSVLDSVRSIFPGVKPA